MEKVYAISFHEEESCGESSGGLSYILKTKELARKYLETIFNDEIINFQDMGEELIIDKQEDYFIIECGNKFVEFRITSSNILEK